MATAHVQPIAGVSAGAENEMMTVFPSVGSTGFGRALGRLYESIPLGGGPVKLSHLLFALPGAPFGALLYFYLKILGRRYVLTNRSVLIKSALGGTEFQRIDLADVADVRVTQYDGQQFYRCGDLDLLGADGKTILQLPGVPHAEILRETILKARDSAVQVKSSLATIEARHSS